MHPLSSDFRRNWWPLGSSVVVDRNGRAEDSGGQAALVPSADHADEGVC